ncbi:MAG: NAD(P)-binding protein [Alphaproteobacteria bacterium]|nr:NAD(P)-binding protein [Alphaproteobacteria bacterium]
MRERFTIVGAGPAGLACAIVLARAGAPVLVREWHERVGARFHGDFQGLENWTDEGDVLAELRSAGINTDFENIPVSVGTAFDGRANSYRLSSAEPLYYLVRRGSNQGCLDDALLNQALALGVDVRFGDRARTADDATVLAIGPRTADAIAVGYVFDTTMADGSWLALDDRLAPLGYSYLLVYGGKGTVATCIFKGFREEAEYVARTVRFFREHTDLVMKNPRPFGGYANFRLPRTARQGERIVVGEQAGFQDALAGFGMRYALRSGILAAKSVLTGEDYTALWRQALWPLLKTGTVNRFLFNWLGEAGKRHALRTLSRGDARRILMRFYRPSLFSDALFPIARLRYRAILRDPSCQHVDCQCVWCRCALDRGESRMS